MRHQTKENLEIAGLVLVFAAVMFLVALFPDLTTALSSMKQTTPPEFR